MLYEFRDTRTDNLLDAFSSEREALIALRDAFQIQGQGVLENLMLVEDDPERNHSRVMAVGVGLLYRTLHLP
ncbi:MAG TPA: hypothetical protein VM450_06905 [Thermomicrobiales bacterium]|jgi:hypothetical protein|nr:hypothetical protein [Thermomicrobiales bacterium]